MASFQIEWKNSAWKELEKLPRQIITRVVAAVDDLSANPYPHGVRKLVGSEYAYRIRNWGLPGGLSCFREEIDR